MTRGRLLSALLTVCTIAGAAAADDAAETACAGLEPAITRLDGRLTLRDYAGPPNYESVAGGDRLEQQWILMLDRPLCVVADPGSDPDLETMRELVEVQLVVFPGTEVPADAYRDRRIGVEGSLFTAHTGHHRTPVLLQVRSFAPAIAPRAADKVSSP
jgi:hypothetical protein